jgi:hypothetical protein
MQTNKEPDLLCDSYGQNLGVTMLMIERAAGNFAGSPHLSQPDSMIVSSMVSFMVLFIALFGRTWTDLAGLIILLVCSTNAYRIEDILLL